MSTLIVSLVSIIFLARYYSVLNSDVYKTLPKKRRDNARKGFVEMAVGLFLANFVAILVAKPVPIVTLVIAVIYFAFIVFLTVNVKIWTEYVQVYDDKGRKVFDDYGYEQKEAVKDKGRSVKTLFTIWCLSVPMAVCVVYAKASLAGANFLNPLKTLKGFLWAFILPLIVVAIIAVVHFLRISGVVLRFADWLIGDDDEDETEEESPARETPSARTANDEYEDIYSNSPRWYQQVNWVYVGCAVFVIAVIVVCGIILLNEFV